jgi:hypothetical protein
MQHHRAGRSRLFSRPGTNPGELGIFISGVAAILFPGLYYFVISLTVVVELRGGLANAFTPVAALFAGDGFHCRRYPMWHCMQKNQCPANWPDENSVPHIDNLQGHSL